jgi:voltage-gated potassium channel
VDTIAEPALSTRGADRDRGWRDVDALVRLVTRLFLPRRLPLTVGCVIIGLLAAGLTFSLVEGPRVSAWDGVWWAFVTVTTVGYGDVTPHTDAGRAIAISVMVVGIGFLFLLTGALVERFIALEIRRDMSGLAEPEQEILRQVSEVARRLEGIDERLARLEEQRGERSHTGAV